MGRMNNERRGGELLADYGTLPDVHLIERSGREISLGELKGNVWVADFIFTNCGGTCPMMTAKMSDLQNSLKDAEKVKLVSFSVDPKRDQPEKLKSYADGFQADKDKWLFLTGSEQQMQDLAKKNFLLTVEEGTDPKEPIIHSQRFVLVDAEGHIRGYYNSGETEAKQKLLTDIGILLREME
jgi:protein SCO1